MSATENEKLAIELAAATHKINQLERERRKVGISFRRIPENGSQIEPLLNGDFPYLQPIDSLSYRHKDRVEEHGDKALPSMDGNISLLEGENLAVLSTLQLTHKGRVDVIYIDPPYNTGNNDFIYNDARISSVKDIVDENGETVSIEQYETFLDGKARTINADDPERHSLWLSFMERRLFLAKELLTESGIIYISIDDNEQARLKLLMDSIFGESNFINQMIWVNNLKGRQLKNGGAVKTYEYILVYAKNAENIPTFSLDIKTAREVMPSAYAKSKEYKVFTDEIGEYVIKNELHNTNSLFNEETRPNLVYNIHYSEKLKAVKFSSVAEEIEFEGFIKISPYKNNNLTHKYHAWRWSKEKILRELDDLLFLKKNDTYKIYTKIRSFDNCSLKDIITNIGSGKIDSILGRNKFNFPKPVSLIKILLKASASKDAIILDFFAGSGTTGQAVAELNTEDNGTRQCILVTHGEENGKNIAEEVTAKRLKRVLSGNHWHDKKSHPQLSGELTYMKLLYSKKQKNSYTAMETMQSKFSGLISLEQDALISSYGEYYTALNSSKKGIIVLTNQDYIYEAYEEVSNFLASYKETHAYNKYMLYIPTSENYDQFEFDVEGWEKVLYPTEYLYKHNLLIKYMKERNLLLEIISSQTTEENRKEQ